ncbi:helix-turn-helix domain-containing protein [Pseudomonas kilonensis]|jgi:predicted transcriptional regulator|uniref:helix-turn-helix domain-containing protein n=1 Tax=Pseudomonas kilonensis TaxID=132476 RepID=UPI001E54424B|nr:helix-turn-helix domain-containing protein [uncultured Pseudomonas sp.]
MANPPALRAQTQWFHVFRAMIDQGDVARIGPHAFTVYAVIKAHANFDDGLSKPGIQRISEQSGVSQAQVKRALGVLEEAGLIAKKKCGRANQYNLREKVQLLENGLPHTVATWDYVPSRAQHTVSELKKAMTAGDLVSTQILNIERLNIQINLAGGNAQVDSSSLQIDLDRLPPSIRETLSRHLKNSQ